MLPKKALPAKRGGANGSIAEDELRVVGVERDGRGAAIGQAGNEYSPAAPALLRAKKAGPVISDHAPIYTADNLTAVNRVMRRRPPHADTVTDSREKEIAAIVEISDDI